MYRLFVDEFANTITEENTGLMWQLQDDGMKRTFEESHAYCRAMALTGYQDWRLPSFGEIKNVSGVWNQVFVQTKFDAPYWSSTVFENPVRDVHEDFRYAARVFYSKGDGNQCWLNNEFYTRAIRRATSYSQVDSFRSWNVSGDISIVEAAVFAAGEAMKEAVSVYKWGETIPFTGFGAIIIHPRDPLYKSILDKYDIKCESNMVCSLGNYEKGNGQRIKIEITGETYYDDWVNEQLLQLSFSSFPLIDQIGYLGASICGRILRKHGVGCWICRYLD